MSLASRVVLALLTGMAAGLLLRDSTAVVWIEPLGTLWVNGIRMTVLPLILALLIVGIGEVGDAKRIGTLGVRSITLFVIMLSAVAILTAVSAPALYSLLVLDPAATAALRASVGAVPAGVSASASARDFILSLVPPNVFRAAADGAMLPFLIFTVMFGIALNRLPADVREPAHRFFRAVREAMFVIIGWVLAVAPIGVFALGFSTAARVGAQAFGAMGYYIGLVILLHVIGGVALYALAVVGGRVPLRRFARAMAPAQAVALSSRSSYATLPALLDAADRSLRMPPHVSSFVLPLAVATFKLTSPIYWTLGGMLVAQLYGIDITVTMVITLATMSVLLNAATPGIPSGGLLIQAPIYLSVGLPVEGIGLLIAVDAIPDMFKTAFNVTADMVVALLVMRWTGAELSAPEPVSSHAPSQVA